MSSVLLLSLLVVPTAFSQERWEERTFERTIDVSGIREVVAKFGIGNVKIVSSDGRQIRVHAVRKVKGGTAEQRRWWLDSSSIEVGSQGGKATIIEKQLKDDRDWGNHNSFNMQMDAEIRVPRGVALELATGVGNVQASRLSNSIRITTGAGNVDLSDIGSSSPVDIRTGAGNIRLQGRTGNLKVDSGAGSVHLKQVSLEGRDVEVNVGAGEIVAEITRVPSGKLNLSSGVGNVSVSLPSGVGANLTSNSKRERGPGDLGTRMEGTVGRTKVSLSSGIGKVSLRGASVSYRER
jgi:hypothetical protein